MNSLVSVIIPVHNRATQLIDAVTSIQSQHSNVEIIIVDDASTDNSVLVIRELAESNLRIKFKLLEINKGGGYARNVGIDLARGDWIAFLDSDDVWLPGKLQAQLAALQVCHGAASLCFTNLVVDFHNNTPIQPWNTQSFTAGDSVKQFLLRQHQVVQTSTIVMSATAAKKIRFNDTLQRHQDIDFVLRCEMANLNFIYVDENLVRYSADPNAARVSKRVNATPSLQWLEIAKDYLTAYESDAFYLQHVFDIHFKDKPIEAIHRSWHGVTNNSQSIVEFIARISRQIVPQSIKNLRNAVQGR
jgi:glycosyltransferase involved in cell wall biosynthesis